MSEQELIAFIAKVKIDGTRSPISPCLYNHKDKAIESIVDAINVGVAPNFIKAELEKRG